MGDIMHQEVDNKLYLGIRLHIMNFTHHQERPQFHLTSCL